MEKLLYRQVLKLEITVDTVDTEYGLFYRASMGDTSTMARTIDTAIRLLYAKMGER